MSPSYTVVVLSGQGRRCRPVGWTQREPPTPAHQLQAARQRHAGAVGPRSSEHVGRPQPGVGGTVHPFGEQPAAQRAPAHRGVCGGQRRVSKTAPSRAAASRASASASSPVVICALGCGSASASAPRRRAPRHSAAPRARRPGEPRTALCVVPDRPPGGTRPPGWRAAGPSTSQPWWFPGGPAGHRPLAGPPPNPAAPSRPGRRGGVEQHREWVRGAVAARLPGARAAASSPPGPSTSPRCTGRPAEPGDRATGPRALGRPFLHAVSTTAAYTGLGTAARVPGPARASAPRSRPPGCAAAARRAARPARSSPHPDRGHAVFVGLTPPHDPCASRQYAAIHAPRRPARPGSAVLLPLPHLVNPSIPAARTRASERRSPPRTAHLASTPISARMIRRQSPTRRLTFNFPDVGHIAPPRPDRSITWSRALQQRGQASSRLARPSAPAQQQP